jgi:chain length determinant protein EpsF
MSIAQYLRIIWARKWLVLALLGLTTLIGSLVTLFVLSKQYEAEASLVVEVRNDPVLGALAPGLASPAYLATQVEILKSDRVAGRVVKMLGVERSPAAVQQWRDSTDAKIPLDRYFAALLQRGLLVEPSRGSNVINITFVNPDAAFAAAAANAFAQAYMDVSVELRVEPARQSASFMDEQTNKLRVALENAQARLSRFQQEKGIVVTDERMDQETQRLNVLLAQLATAQAEQVDTAMRQRNTGTELSPDVQNSPTVQSLKAQLVVAEAKMSEISAIVGPNHPQRQSLEAQIRELRTQLATEIRRVLGGQPRQRAEGRRDPGNGRRAEEDGARDALAARPDGGAAARRRQRAARLRGRQPAGDGAQPRRPEHTGQRAAAQPGHRAVHAVAAAGRAEHPRLHRRRAAARRRGGDRPRDAEPPRAQPR